MPDTFFDPHQRATVEAAMARIIPTDDTPGAREAGCIDFLERYLSGIGYIFAKPDGSGFETLEGRSAEAWKQRIEIMRGRYVEGLRDLDDRARGTIFDVEFVDLAPRQQDEDPAGAREGGLRRKPTTLARERRAGRPRLSRTRPAADLDRGRPRLPAAADNPHPPGLLRRPDLWRQQGPDRLEGDRFPRPASLEEVHTGRYTTLQYFADGRSREGQGVPRWPISRSLRKTEVVIIGAGASGAAAAKVLCEAGVKVVALEKGPWRRKESFGGDELANINRYNLWPDPILNPRTWRETAGRRGALGNVLPGAADGGRRHGALAGLAAALHRRTIFACAPSPATCPAPAWPTGQSPMTNSNPTISRWSGRSASRASPAPTSSRSSVPAAIPARRCRCRAMRRSSCRAATRSAGMPSRPRRRRCRAPSTAAGRRWSAPSRSSTAIRPARALPPSTSSFRTRWRPAISSFARTVMFASWCSTARAR